VFSYVKKIILNLNKKLKRLDNHPIVLYNFNAYVIKEITEMKENVHPNYHTVKVVCACGNTFETGSTKDGDVLKIDICNKCHPFFTGTQKIVDAGGRVERFNKRYGIKK